MRYNSRIGYVKFYIELKKENNGADGKYLVQDRLNDAPGWRNGNDQAVCSLEKVPGRRHCSVSHDAD
ncbi:hypothetical protein GCM10008014_58960 [Paenibacillus silvae]|uniref:Uncharacterized protein n=1 Tax=Paenibacillus silvae TaxID=1325358 RepID=A0ABQ1ZR51_9BACL|nr:hypothetical protein GCM10008014_58960 [Paenibacillus silvae]